jgi:hypothetical protein
VARPWQRNVVIIARSGDSKSSIVYAGLFPALRRKKGLGDESVWRIVHPHRCSNLMRPSTRQVERDSVEWLAALNANSPGRCAGGEER